MDSNKIKELIKKVDTNALMEREFVEWRDILIDECQVYVFNENYIAKRFDQINYQFCSKDEAKEILTDNLYALLRFKYFTSLSDDSEVYISGIIKSFCSNLKTSLRKISFDKDSDCDRVNLLSKSQIAFRNGVYDFKENRWLFKYDIITIPSLSNKIYLYDPNYIILWYIDINFEPLPFSLKDTNLNDFIKLLKELSKEKDSCYCFKLVYNMSFNNNNKFDIKRFTHICEILGYTILQDFCQSFVMLIGTGGNGKNSLFDGCFTPYVRPFPASNDLNSIENDKFITGSLENKYQNIFLESDAKTYQKSTILKNLTGSIYQTIEKKGINKYSGLINCKYIFSANDQDKVKFGDNTDGFRRRINMFEIFYRWDEKKSFLKRGDYYDTTFSEDLHEIKNDITNVVIYIYLGMYGILKATNDFTTTFKFTSNDWNDKYMDIDEELKDRINSISFGDICNYLSKKGNEDEKKVALFGEDNKRLYQSKSFLELGYKGFSDIINLLSNDELRINYFANNDMYVSVRFLYDLCHILTTPTSFTQSLKKMYRIREFPFYYNNKPYIRINCKDENIKVIN